uniref:D-amino-acid oxidase n=1 Tax=Phallusia mammillata TaxID=59560 RepID=A0A6F9DBA7_9ASCI|nr:D-aspartate oxidase-like [Phallusia mammillata]
MTLKIAVIGAGVVGLSSALCLAQNFPTCEVTVIASEFYPERQGITSVHGFGIIGHRREGLNTNPKVSDWLLKTREYCRRMHPTVAELAGIRPIDAILTFHEKGEQGLNSVLPERARHLQNLKKITEKQAKELLPLSQDGAMEMLFPPLKAEHNLFAFETSTYVIDSSLYLPWLKNELASLKMSNGEARVTFVCRKISTLDELTSEFDLVVNCAGFNAGRITNDPNIFPIRGQYISIEKTIGIEKVIAGRETVVCPRVNDICLGGVYQEGRSDTQVDPQDTESILRRCETLVPAVKGAKVLRVDVGIRPARYGGARLELEWWQRNLKPSSEVLNAKKLPVIHNYGHGGTGFAVHWGCALEVARLAKSTYSERAKL